MAMPSPTEVLNDTCRELQNLIEKECSKISFTCGGTITIKEDSDAARKAHAQSSDPVNLFWKSSKDVGVHSMTLPVPNSNSSIEQLASDCTVASFGKGDEDVVDPEYRRAGKLDKTQFASSFHPADLGLVENIEQILLPNIRKKKDDPTFSKKLVADLYKLNVYSGPSGHFKNHVDTPRGSSQIGSLVVCLPSEFEGGNLLVRHREQEFSYDWSSAAKSTIQWAAFYSDCEHEIRTITKGHRITLTYNLHLVDMVGGAIRLPKQIVDPESLPPYELIKSLLEQPDYMAEGGTLGVYCSHAYAHTSKTAAQYFPRHLKGSDLVIYSIFKHLGYHVAVRPVLQNGFGENWMEQDFSEGEDNEYSVEYKAVLAGTRVLVGTKLHPHVEVPGIGIGDEGLEGERQMLADNWPYDGFSDIFWLSSPKHQATAMNYVAYGNESTLGSKYSFAAILVTVPPAGDELRRQSKHPKLK